MAHIVQFPRMNPVKFVPLGEVPNPLYNFRHDDRNWFIDSIQYWQRKVGYNQQWQLNDLISIQIHATAGSQVLQIIDCSQTVIETIPLQATTILPGNNYNGDPLSTYQYQFIPEDISLPEGKYWLLLTVTFPDDVEQQYISEPFKVKEVWPGSMLVQYNHSSNEYDIAFSLNPRFSFRVQATLLNPRPQYEDVGFDDQLRNKKLLNSETNYQYDFVIGFKQAVAEEWVIKHLAEAFRCSRVLIDGKQFVKPENEQWEIESRSPTPLCNATLVVQEQNKQQNYTFGDTTIGVYESPLAYPYYVDPIFLNDGGLSLQISDAREVLDAGDEADFIDELNALAAGLGLLGEFTFNSPFVLWQNGQDEPYDSATTVVRAKRMEFELTADLGETLSYLVMGTHGRVYGDGVVSTYEWTGPGSESVVKAYTAGGTYTFKLYHNDDVSYLAFLGVAGEVEITSADSELPVGMTHYFIVQHSLTSFDLMNLLPAEATLQSFIINQNQITSLTGNPFPIVFNSFSPLIVIDVSSNQISVSDVSALIGNFANDADFAGGGTLSTSNQTPPAPPSGVATEIALLTAAGWTVVTD